MYHCFRLHRGQDLYEAVETYVNDHHIAAGAVVSGVGCVSRWRLRDATGVRVRGGEEDEARLAEELRKAYNSRESFVENGAGAASPEKASEEKPGGEENQR